MLTIVNEGFSLTIVNEGSSLTIVIETTNFIKNNRVENDRFHNETITFLKNKNVSIPTYRLCSEYAVLWKASFGFI